MEKMDKNNLKNVHGGMDYGIIYDFSEIEDPHDFDTCIFCYGEYSGNHYYTYKDGEWHLDTIKPVLG